MCLSILERSLSHVSSMCASFIFLVSVRIAMETKASVPHMAIIIAIVTMTKLFL